MSLKPANTIPHISVCVCTFQRPNSLARLLAELERQQTEERFNHSIVIVDNDRHQTAKQIVHDFAQRSALGVQYEVEPEQNIALARNRAVAQAAGDLIAFIDDDEWPARNWLLTLFMAQHAFQVDGILGPVLPQYEVPPPTWVVRGKFYQRPCPTTGTVLNWTETRTGNVLLTRKALASVDSPFRPEFGSGGEDRDFFRRAIRRGCQFVWCAEAPVFETIPPERTRRGFMLRRALLRGAKTPYQRTWLTYLKPIVAVPAYLALLPFLFFIRHDLFMKYLIKAFDHLGRLFSIFGFRPVTENYVIR